jgi:hypothetical protein
MTLAAHTTAKTAPRDRAGHPHPDDVASMFEQDRSIGDIIRDTKHLTQEQIDQIVECQREHGLRFGEAAVKLGLVTNADIVFALSQQFSYPYAAEVRQGPQQELVTASQPFGKQAEAFRAIRSQLMMRIFNPMEPKRALAITSPESWASRWRSSAGAR